MAENKHTERTPEELKALLIKHALAPTEHQELLLGQVADSAEFHNDLGLEVQNG